jgi:hypothetical protein
MPEEPTPNDPNVDDRKRHFDRCGPELRVILEKLDKLIQSNFPDVEVGWEPKKRVSYWICDQRHLWVSIWTNRTHLGLVIRVRKEFEQPDLANILGVPSTDVEINRNQVATGINSFEVQIGSDSNINFEALVQFLQTAHESVLEVWA